MHVTCSATLCGAHLFVDPVNEVGDTGINTRFFLLATAITPAHHSIDIMCVVLLTDKRAPRVSL